MQDDIDFDFAPGEEPTVETGVRIFIVGRGDNARLGTDPRAKDMNASPVVQAVWKELGVAAANWGQFVAYQGFDVYDRGSNGVAGGDSRTTTRDSVLTAVKLTESGFADVLGIVARSDGPRDSVLFPIRCDYYQAGDAFGYPSTTP